MNNDVQILQSFLRVSEHLIPDLSCIGLVAIRDAFVSW